MDQFSIVRPRLGERVSGDAAVVVPGEERWVLAIVDALEAGRVEEAFANLLLSLAGCLIATLAGMEWGIRRLGHRGGGRARTGGPECE